MITIERHRYTGFHAFGISFGPRAVNFEFWRWFVRVSW